MDALKAGGEECSLVTAWQSWIHLENLSAYHDVPFASQDNGFAGLDTELMLNGEAQVAHLTAMGEWAKDGKFIYTGRRNEGGANFRAGDCALFTESSAGYAGIKAEAQFDFDVRPLPYWEGVGNAPQNTIIGGASLWVMEGHEDAEYKDHPEAAAAIYDAALIREAMQQWDNAIGAYTKYVELYPEEDNVREVVFKLPYIEKSKEDYKKAYERFEDLTDRDDVKKTELVEINTQLGLLEVQMKNKSWETKSDKYFTDAVNQWKELEPEDQAKTKYYASESRFVQAERVYADFTQVKLSFPIKQFQKLALKKGELQQEAEKMYEEIISMKSPLWLAASAYRLGQMYNEFSEQIYAIPLPEGLTEDQQFDYQNAVDEIAFPLQEKALTRFRAALRLALENKAYNDWSRKSAEAISKLESEAYPITGEDGVAADHGRVNFSQPRPVTSLETVRERVLRRKANKPEPKPAKPAPAKGEAPNGGQATK
jgi:hypothetical protein